MKFHSSPASCRHCQSTMEQRVLEYAIEHFNFALCISCQQWIEQKLNTTTRETIDLYLSLLKRSVPATLQQFDGKKTVGIALVDASLHVEAATAKPGSGEPFLFDPLQTLAIYNNGYFTLTVPNALVKDNLENTADFITGLLTVNR